LLKLKSNSNTQEDNDTKSEVYPNSQNKEINNGKFESNNNIKNIGKLSIKENIKELNDNNNNEKINFIDEIKVNIEIVVNKKMSLKKMQIRFYQANKI